MHRNELALLPKLPLLITESADEFDALRDAFEQEIKPRGIIAQMYVHDFCSIVWEIQRLRRAKAAIINAAFRDALVHVLTECLSSPEKLQLDLDDQVQTLALAWFKNEQGKKRVARTLNESGFDEYAIEGEAIRGRRQLSNCSTACWPRWRRAATGRFAASANIAMAGGDNCASSRIG